MSPFDNPHKNAVAATLAWLARERGMIFDAYYDAYRLGVHYGGGDPISLPFGHLTGSLVVGGRHLEQFYFLAHKFKVHIVMQGDSLMGSVAANLDVHFVARAQSVTALYQDVFEFFERPLPSEVVVVDSRPVDRLQGLDAYFYPEIYFRKLLGVEASISEGELRSLLSGNVKLCLAAVGDKRWEDLPNGGCLAETIDRLEANDSFRSVTERLAKRWLHEASGWLLGDPVLVSYWLPRACEEGLLPIYGQPQTTVIEAVSTALKGTGRVVLGRQFDDRDFFALSRRDQCLQVVDPSRPPFSSIKHAEYNWSEVARGFFDEEPSDELLRSYAENNKVLVSIVFWSGMIRELENLYALTDLVALTKLRSGLVLTAQSFEYMRHSPLELLTVPLDRGGVYPCLEPLLGSCGIGVAIESLMSPGRLEENLKLAMGRIRELLGREDLLPRGWWATMDAPMMELPWHRRPLPLRVRSDPPYVRLRYRPNGYRPVPADHASGNRNGRTLRQKFGSVIRGSKLSRFLEEYRPYDYYRAGGIDGRVVRAVKSAGLEYMLTKSGFGVPRAQYLDDGFIALNYTVGRWDGWTPFLTINDVSDLQSAERKALRNKAPGWILGTLDSCLWTFSGPLWERSGRLLLIARYVAGGGDSSRLVNVTPHAIARYARIVEEGRQVSVAGGSVCD
ncbi:MAG: hypothetical protein HY675_21090 [Chloroflexi bacterium]|nr:hypothetical protein [Chloroflexota bacterium]